MLRIFQIGNYRVNLVASSNQGLSMSTPTSFRRPSDELTGMSGDIVYVTPGRPLVKSGKWQVEGSLLCGAQQTCASVDQQFNRLIANGGDIVPIIGILPPECCPCINCHGTGCSDCNTKPESVWLLTYGMVTDYKSDYKQEVNGRFGDGELNVSMTIEGAVYWEPLNDIEWHYRGRNLPTYPDETGVVTKHFHPYMPSWNGPASSGFQRHIGNFMFYPANWIQAYSRVRNRRPRAVLTSTDYTTPTVTLTTGVPQTHVVDLPYINWPAQPKSLYYFSNLPQEGIITIGVDTLTPNGYTINDEATLDLSELNESSLLPTGIHPADAVIAGPLFGSYNGVYLLGGGTLVDLYVPWSKTSTYPGETYVGRNTITVSLTDVENDLDFAYIHIFRRY